jgi:pyridoxamine 5'-phosphate oxidase
MPDDPLALFQTLFVRAGEAGEPDPSAHVLATASDAQPSARCLLLKGTDARGFVFFTNQRSRKGRDLAANPRAAIVFLWPRLGMEVRARGTVVPIPTAESDDYFASRPRGSQLGAWASRQSSPLAWRGQLVLRWLAFAVRFFGRRVPRPVFWGGFRLQPDTVEFVRRDNATGREERTEYARSASGWRLDTTHTFS